MPEKGREQRTMTEQLRDEIRRSGKSLGRLAQESGVSAGQLSRFLNGKRGLTTAALDKLFQTLELRVTKQRRRPAKEGE
jgi:transcriptional regulator with XRE-family HTH domain